MLYSVYKTSKHSMLRKLLILALLDIKETSDESGRNLEGIMVTLIFYLALSYGIINKKFSLTYLICIGVISDNHGTGFSYCTYVNIKST